VTEGYSDTVQIVQKTDKSVLDILFSENGQWPGIDYYFSIRLVVREKSNENVQER
jgi:hypothetical protein